MCSRPRKPQRKPNPSACEVSGSIRERGVVERQALERVAQVLVAVGLDRIQAGEDHRLHLAIAGQRLGGRAPLGGERVADPQLRDVLEPGDDVADVAGRHRPDRAHRRREEPDLVDLGLGAGLHGDDRLTLLELAVEHPQVCDHAAVLVELRVEDQRPRRRVGIALGGRDLRDHGLEYVAHALARLRRDPQDVVGVASDQIDDLTDHPLGLGARQVDLVEHRDDLEPRLDRGVGVGDRLRLHPLGRVDDEDRALAGGEAARDLVREVHVAGRVDQVQVIRLAVVSRVVHAHGLRLDRDPALALEIHRVEQLRHVVAVGDRPGELEDPIGERRLAVVDVGDDREVPNPVHGRMRIRPPAAAGSDFPPGLSEAGRSASSP